MHAKQSRICLVHMGREGTKAECSLLWRPSLSFSRQKRSRSVQEAKKKPPRRPSPSPERAQGAIRWEGFLRRLRRRSFSGLLENLPVPRCSKFPPQEKPEARIFSGSLPLGWSVARLKKLPAAAALKLGRERNQVGTVLRSPNRFHRRACC